GLGLCLVIAGLARPQSGRSESKITGEGIAIELVLDISGSMEALDFQLKGRDIGRLDAVKHVIREFILGSRESGLSGRPDDLPALVSSGGLAEGKSRWPPVPGAWVKPVRGWRAPRRAGDPAGGLTTAQAWREGRQRGSGAGGGAGVAGCGGRR